MKKVVRRPQLNLKLLKRIDEIYTESPEYGSRKIRNILRREGQQINRKRVQRLMRIIGIQAIFPGKSHKKFIIGTEHKVYPYLLRNLQIVRPNQVWSTDITYIPMKNGFIYLTAIMDWYSRKILSWEVSTSMDLEFCLSVYKRAVNIYGPPEIINTDQGSQYTAIEYRKMVKESGAQLSMDGKGKYADNIVIERFWRTIKYGEVYIKDYNNVKEAIEGIGKYIHKYNDKRPHDAHGINTPSEVYQLVS